MNEQEVHFQLTARYYTSGQLTLDTKQIWIVLHGYGQLARFFLRKFDILTAQHVYVIAPEGLSKFYLEDVNSRVQSGNNKVGATWMTRDNRVADIENNINFLNSIYEREVPKNFAGTVTILGFSQGAATATRWALESSSPYNALILWGGILPPDMDFEKASKKLTDKRLIEVIGRNDPFLNDARVREMNSLNQKLKIKPEIIEFDGGHELNEQVLFQIAAS